MKTYYITTPIYYVNDSPHIGHAYTTLACDVLARFMRLDGYRVMFLTGTDEHGQKVEKAARAAGVDPQAFTDKVSQNFRDLTKALNISNDDFIRTTEDRHIKASQAIWRAMAATKSPKGRDNIYLKTYGGWYAVRDEAFYSEKDTKLGPDGKRFSIDTGAEVEWVEEPSYFFRLSDWQDTLLNFYEANPDFIGPGSRRNEVISFVKRGLEDLSISRTTFKWGVPVPDAPGHIMYVWVDALTNYITAVGYPDTNCEAFKSFWPADLHMVGKDILRFHAVYWPAFLMAAGLKVQKRVFAHGWWTNEGQKISKSLGNVIEPNALIDKYGLDPVRYFMLREVPFGQDGDFSHRAMIHRLSSDLANDLGNLVQRVMSFIYRNCDGAIPDCSNDEFDLDADFLHSIASLVESHELLDELRPLMAQQQFHLALDEIWAVVRSANVDVDRIAPWTLKKTNPARMRVGLFVLAEVIRHTAILLQPFIPGSANKVLDQLGVQKEHRTFEFLNRGGVVANEHSLKAGAAIPEPAPIFKNQSALFEDTVTTAIRRGNNPFAFGDMTIQRNVAISGAREGVQHDIDLIIESGDRVYLVEMKMAKRPGEIVSAAQQAKLYAEQYRRLHKDSGTQKIIPLVIVPTETNLTAPVLQGVPILKFDWIADTFEMPPHFERIALQSALK